MDSRLPLRPAPHRAHALLASLLAAACGGAEPTLPSAPPASSATAPEGTAPKVLPATAEVASLAVRLLADGVTAADRAAAKEAAAPLATVMLRNGASADPTTQAKVPAALIALGNAAWPSLAAGLGEQDTTVRRLAALTLLQLGDTLHREGAPEVVLTALATARGDADARVRAAAEFAWRRATGDTSALDAARAAHDAAERAAATRPR